MQSFTYHSPTKVIFGREAENQAAQEIKAFGGSRVMIVYGGGSIVKSGLLSRMEALLKEAGLPSVSFGGVQPNPLLSHARKGIEEAIAFQADFILAVGGGSVIDTAKAIAHGVANPDADIWKFWCREVPVEKSIPVGVILTISAAGSETSDSAVLTNEEIHIKRGLNTPYNRPRFALMNPELTYTLPKYQIACGIVDIMMHTLDRYFVKPPYNRMTDEIAEGLLRNVVENGKAALRNPQDYGPMSELMWAGSLSHNGLTGLGNTTDFAVHQLGHELSARFNIAHGASLAVMWASWARYCMDANPERFAQYAEKVWGIREGSIEERANRAINATADYFASLDMPICFSQAGIATHTDDQLAGLADGVTYYGGRETIGAFKLLRRDDIQKIYQAANE